MMEQAAERTIPEVDEFGVASPRRIHVSQLMVGMTVLKEREDGKLVTDCTLLRRFTNSSPRLALAFVTTAKQNVVWVNCGYVWVK